MALVKMRHDDPVATAGPTTADVPEEAVAEWQKLGWYLDKAKEPETPKAEPEPEAQPEKPKSKKKAKEQAEAEPSA